MCKHEKQAWQSCKLYVVDDKNGLIVHAEAVNDVNDRNQFTRQIEHAQELSADAVLIKLGDKISNVIDVTNNPPADWSLERRKEYLDWAEAVINNCPKVNSALERHLAEVLKEGQRSL